MVSLSILQGCADPWCFSCHVSHHCFCLYQVHVVVLLPILWAIPCILGFPKDPTLYIYFVNISFWCFLGSGRKITLLSIVFIIISSINITLLKISGTVKVPIRLEIFSSLFIFIRFLIFPVRYNLPFILILVKVEIFFPHGLLQSPRMSRSL